MDISGNTVTPEIVDVSGNTDTPEIVDVSENTDTPKIVDVSGNTDTPEIVDVSGNTDTPEIKTYELHDNSGNIFVVTPTFSWKIFKMEVTPYVNGMKNIVKNIQWCYYATIIINDVTYSTYYSDITVLQPPNDFTFIPYEELTKDVVSSWLEKNVNMDFVNNFILNNLQNAFSPPVISLPLPF